MYTYTQVKSANAPDSLESDPWDMYQLGRVPLHATNAQKYHSKYCNDIDPDVLPYSETFARSRAQQRNKLPYNPFKATLQKCRQQSHTSSTENGLRDLRERIDMLVLREEYQNSFNNGTTLHEKQLEIGNEQSEGDEQNCKEGPYLACADPANQQENESCSEKATSHHQQQIHLWRPEYAVAEPDFFHAMHATLHDDGTLFNAASFGFITPQAASPASSTTNDSQASNTSSESWRGEGTPSVDTNTAIVR